MEHGEEMVRIMLTGEDRYVEGALNGVNFRLPTGVPVDVPMRIWRVLEESRKKDPCGEWMMNGFTAEGGKKLP